MSGHNKTEQQELLPCPFCGKTLEARWNKKNPDARCATEGCKATQLPRLNLDDQEDIDRWNRRTPFEYKTP